MNVCIVDTTLGYPSKLSYTARLDLTNPSFLADRLRDIRDIVDRKQLTATYCLNGTSQISVWRGESQRQPAAVTTTISSMVATPWPGMGSRGSRV